MSDKEAIERQIRQLHQQVARLFQQGQYGEAVSLAAQVRDLAEVELGEDHPDFATSLNNLAMLYESMGNYAQAEPLYRLAMEIDRGALGEDHPHFAESLNNLAGLYYSMGKYAQAEPLFRQALEIRRVALGEDHPDFATNLNDLAVVYKSMGNYAQAEPLYRQAMEIVRIAVGENNPSFATILSGLAGLYQSMGNYAQAEPLCRQAMEIRRVALGQDHPDVAASLSGLAGLYQSMGNYGQAEPLYRQALEIVRVALGEDHPHFATSLNNLAGLYRSMGNYAQVEPLCRQAMEIRRVALGEDHRDFAASLNNLAGLYRSMGNYAQAEPLYRQAIDIERVALGEGHPSFAASVNNLAGLYESMGNYAQAAPLFRQAMEIRRVALGKDHPDFAASLNNLAGLYVACDRCEEAFVLMRRASEIDDQVMGQVFSISSDSQRLAFLKTIEGNLHGFLSLVVCHLADSAEAVLNALGLVLRRKSILAEAQAAQRDAVLGGAYPHLKPQVREWSTLRMQIAQKSLAGPGPEGLDYHQQQLAEWNRQRERLESELARQIPEMNLQQKLQAADRRAVALALPENVALVEFVRLNVFNFKAVPARGESEWEPARYVAFVLPAGQPDQVTMIDLGAAAPIDEMIADFRFGITGTIEQRGSLEAMLRDPEELGHSLRAAVFDKLLPGLNGCKRLFLSPDGDLSRLPFEVLPTQDGRSFIDEYQISYLAVGRDALRFGTESTRRPGKPLVVADPDFDLGNANGLSPTAEQPQDCEPQGRRSFDGELGKMAFDPLPGTRLEAERVSRMLGVQPWLDKEALESRLKDKEHNSPRILHLATHGFFLEDQKHDPNEDFRGLSMMSDARGAWGQSFGPVLENPLLRSGLALAGANWKSKSFVPPAEAEDGFLTAEDVTGLNLLDTDLVVLSACETGLGKVHVGEGVFGLRRSFVLAGAKTLIMSLWKAPDLATGILMVRFYDNLLQKRLPRQEALWEAQNYVRNVTVGRIRADWLSGEAFKTLSAGGDAVPTWLENLVSKPDDHRPFTNPLYWGAFICQGDPGVFSFD